MNCGFTVSWLKIKVLHEQKELVEKTSKAFNQEFERFADLHPKIKNLS